MNNTNKILCLICLIVCTTIQSAQVQSPEEKGLEIAREMDKRSEGFVDMTADMKMILRDKHGNEGIRQIRVRALEVKDDGDKSLCIFDEPKDVRGTAFLTFSHKVGDDDQWLYLPALKRVKRISSSNKSGSFMSSEFSYEDIASQEIEKYTYKWIRDEEYLEHQCFVVESYPVDKKNSGYTKQVAWIDQDEYRTWKVEYYDRKDSLLKTLTIKDYKKYNDKFWRPDEMYMINHQTEKSTKLIWSDFKYDTGLSQSDFNKNSLTRIR